MNLKEFNNYDSFIFENREKYFGYLLHAIDDNFNKRFWYLVKTDNNEAECWLLALHQVIKSTCEFNSDQTNHLVIELMKEWEVVPPFFAMAELTQTMLRKHLKIGAKTIFSKTKIQNYWGNFEIFLNYFDNRFRQDIDKVYNENDNFNEDLEEDIQDAISEVEEDFEPIDLEKSEKFNEACKKILDLQLQLILSSKSKDESIPLDCNFTIGYINSFVLNFGRNSFWKFSTESAASQSLLVIIQMIYDSVDQHEKYLELEKRVNHLIGTADTEFYLGYDAGIKLAEEIIKDPNSITKASVTLFSDWYNFFHK